MSGKNPVLQAKLNMANIAPRPPFSWHNSLPPDFIGGLDVDTADLASLEKLLSNLQNLMAGTVDTATRQMLATSIARVATRVEKRRAEQRTEVPKSAASKWDDFC